MYARIKFHTYNRRHKHIRNHVITKESIKALITWPIVLNLSKQTNIYYDSSGLQLQLHRQTTGRHKPRTLRSLLETPGNYFVLSSDYARVSTLMVGTQQVVGNTINTCKAKPRISWHGLTAISNFSWPNFISKL